MVQEHQEMVTIRKHSQYSDLFMVKFIFLVSQLIASAQYNVQSVPDYPTIYTATMNYPQNGVEGYNITAIWVELTHNDGAQNVFSILSGGIGKSNAVVRMESQNTRDFGYLTRIYGTPL